MSVVAAPGFVANGLAAGIKASGDKDLAIVATADGQPVPTAAVFTQNLVVAAPVTVSRKHLAASGGHAAAVILNSGCANAGTGDRGLDDAEAMCSATAQARGCQLDEVLVCSTGHIGPFLPIDKVTAAVPALASKTSAEPAQGVAAAEAILTTDTRIKLAVARHGDVVVGGMAKGAGMVAPNMATMLAVLTTNASADPATLQKVLTDGVADSFNAVTVDGCTSTNDTVTLMANGQTSSSADPDVLAQLVADVCLDLATQLVGDGEGHTRVVRVTVTGAADDAEARQAARRVADNLLVKCSWYGGHQQWGRVAAAVGAAGVALNPDLLTIAYGGHVVSRGCQEADHDPATVAEHLAGEYLELTCDLGVGDGTGRVLTNDLTHGYVDENMGIS